MQERTGEAVKKHLSPPSAILLVAPAKKRELLRGAAPVGAIYSYRLAFQKAIKKTAAM